MNLVFFLESPENGHAFLDGRFVDVNLLEPALEGGVLFYVLSVLVESRRPYAVKFSAGEGGLQHVRGVHGAVGGTRSHHGVYLVYEEDCFPFRLGDFPEHGLEPFFELPPVLGSGHQRPDVEGDELFVPESLGNVRIHYALGETLDYGGLSDAGLSYENGIVLRSSEKHAYDSSYLLVPSYDGVDLSRRGQFGEILSVLLKGPHRVFRGLGVHGLSASNVFQRF